MKVKSCIIYRKSKKNSSFSKENRKRKLEILVSFAIRKVKDDDTVDRTFEQLF